jgi:chromate reductase
MKIVMISGSLRAASSNTALVRALISVAPAGVEASLYDGLGDLLHFSPELTPTEAVLHFRAEVASADGVLICTPEYAYGIPGSLKNALDWLVFSGELWRKPVAVLSASPSALGGEKAHAALSLTLSALEAQIVAGASQRIPFITAKLNAAKEVSDTATLAALGASLAALIAAVEERAREGVGE